jgi:hypothetical protein
MRRARQLRGWKLYFLLILLTYPILFLGISLKAFRLRLNSYFAIVMSLREVAIWAAIGTAWIVAGVFYSRQGKD